MGDYLGSYAVFICDRFSDGDFQLLPHVEPITCRNELKSRGRATFRKLSKAEVNTAWTSGGLPEIVQGKHIVIMETADPLPDPFSDLEKRVWLGKITSSVSNFYEGQDNSQGTFEAVEFGEVLYSEGIQQFQDSRLGGILQNPPAFNPVDPADGEIWGNRDISNKFKYRGLDKTVDGLTDPENESFWSRREVIQSLVENYTSVPVDISYPDDLLDCAFLDYKERPQSFENFKGRGLGEALDILLEPLDWYLDFKTSTSSLTIKVVHTNPIETQDLPPVSGGPYYINSSNTSGGIINFEMSENDDVYDQITLEGDRIYCFGTVSTWNAAGQKTLERGWTDEDVVKYINGSDTILITDQGAANSYRNTSPVYREYIFSPEPSGSECWIQLARTPATSSDFVPVGTNDINYTFSKYAFCPAFTIDGSGGVTWTDDIEESPMNHSTPNELTIEYLDFLPAKRSDGSFYNPFVRYLTAYGSFITGRYVWINLTDPDGDKISAKIQFTNKGFRLDMPYPETLAYIDDVDLFKDNDGNYYGPVYSDPWLGTETNTRYNPKAPRGYGFFGSWERMIATIGIKSDQRVSYTINNPSSSAIKKKKLIRDESLQVWYVSPGTVFTDVFESNSSTYPELLFTDSAQLYRNDAPLLISKLHNYAEQLFTRYGEGTLEATLNAPGLPVLGQYITQFIDGGFTRDIKTLVASVEKDFNKESPRTLIGFGRPATPSETSIENAIETSSVISPSSSKSLARTKNQSYVEATPARIETPKLISIGESSVAGGSSDIPEIWISQVVGGNTLSDGTPGIKYVITTPSLSGGSYNIYSDPILPNGLGYGYLFIDSEQQFTSTTPPSASLIYLINNAGQAVCSGEWVRVSTSSVDLSGGTGYRILGF